MPKGSSPKPDTKPENVFITFEGGEGAGKSTQIKLLAEKLEAEGHELVVTREPGGTPGAEAIRHTILSGHAENLGPDVEAMLFSAARSDHVENLIRPALDEGKTILCDRFIDSTRVYQGITGKVSMDYLYELEKVACNGIWPDLTLVLDVDVETGMKRAATRRGKNATPDRFEKESIRQQEARRQAFLQVAQQEPERCIAINARGTQKQVAARIWKAVQKLLRSLKD